MELRPLARAEPLRQEVSLREATLIRDEAQLLDRRQVATTMTTDTDSNSTNRPRLHRETTLAHLAEA